MNKEEMIQLLTVKALSYGLDPLLVQSIVKIESNFNEWAIRFEPNWMYYYLPARFASQLGISNVTERTLQQMSFGPMQIMGSVAREFGFDEPLVKLCDPDLGIQYGCMKLAELKKKYRDEQDIISSYNQGSPTKFNGVYRNLSYVQKVTDELLKLRSLSKSVGSQG